MDKVILILVVLAFVYFLSSETQEKDFDHKMAEFSECEESTGDKEACAIRVFGCASATGNIDC